MMFSHLHRKSGFKQTEVRIFKIHKRDLLKKEPQSVFGLRSGSDLFWSDGGRTRLEEVRSENVTLQERLRVVQQEVENMEEDAAKKR